MPRTLSRLFAAIEAGRVSEVGAILDQAPELLEVTPDDLRRTRDKTPLMYAIQCGAVMIARDLLRRGADVGAHMRGGPGSSVLQLAVTCAGPREQDHDAMRSLVGDLLDRGADPGEALWTACSAYHPRWPWRLSMIELLLARGADPERTLPGGTGSVRALLELNASRLAPEVLGLFGIAPGARPPRRRPRVARDR